jgi:hypothetical protein
MWVTQAVQMYRNSFVFQIPHVTHFGSLLVTFFDFFYSSRRDLFNDINSVVTKFLICLQDVFLLFFTFSLFFISLGVPRRVERSDKKKIPWRHVEALIVTPLVLLKRSWQDKSQNTIKKILTVTRVCHTSHSKVNESQYIGITHVAHSGNRLWSFFISLNLSCRYLSNGIDGVIVRVSMCL